MLVDPGACEARRILCDAPADRRFVLHDGSSVSGLRELYSAFRSMRDDVFYHHVTPDRNDFAAWVKDVFKDYQLSHSLFSTKSKNGCMSRLGDRIYELDKLSASPDKVLLLPAPAPDLSFHLEFLDRPVKGADAAPRQERRPEAKAARKPEPKPAPTPRLEPRLVVKQTMTAKEILRSGPEFGQKIEPKSEVRQAPKIEVDYHLDFLDRPLDESPEQERKPGIKLEPKIQPRLEVKDALTVKPEPRLEARPKQELRKCPVEVSPAELERTLQEITRRSLEKRKLERAAKPDDRLKKASKSLSAMDLRRESENHAPEFDFALPSSMDDILAGIEREQSGGWLGAVKDVFSAQSFADSAAELKVLLSVKRMPKPFAAPPAPSEGARRDDMIEELKKAHGMFDGL